MEEKVTNSLDSIYAYAYWRHCISLGDGNFTPGVRFENNWEKLHFPSSLKGMSFLDVGANDGMYCFLAESRGASRVVAVDIYHNERHQWEMTNGWPVYGIQAVKDYRKSKVEIESKSILDLNYTERSFDYVFCGNVIMWVNDPYSAHLKLAAIAGKTLHIREDMFVNEGPAQLRFSKLWKPGGEKPMFAANKTYYREVLGAAGFKDIEFYEIDEQQEWREFIRKCPRIIAPAGTSTFVLPQNAEPSGVLCESRNGRISAQVGDKAYVVGIGWLRIGDLKIITEDSADPSVFQRWKMRLENRRNRENRQSNFSIIAHR